MRNIYFSDYILWDLEKDCPAETITSIYHFSKVIEQINGGLMLNGRQFVSLGNLPIEWQKKVSHARQKEIGFPFNEGDTYYTIDTENWEVVESVWDDVAEELYMIEDHEMHYETREIAEREMMNIIVSMNYL